MVIEQRIADILELVKLITETSGRDHDILQNVDQHVNDLGVQSININGLLAELKTAIESNGDYINQLSQGQETMASEATALVDQLTQLIEGQTTNEESVNRLAEGIVQLEGLINDAKVDVIERMNSNQQEYVERVTSLGNDFQAVAESILLIEYGEQFEKLQSDTISLRDQLVSIQDRASVNNETVLNRISESAAKLEGVISQIATVNAQSEEIKDDFKSIIARVGVIETKLSANL